MMPVLKHQRSAIAAGQQAKTMAPVALIRGGSSAMRPMLAPRPKMSSSTAEGFSGKVSCRATAGPEAPVGASATKQEKTTTPMVRRRGIAWLSPTVDH